MWLNESAEQERVSFEESENKFFNEDEYCLRLSQIEKEWEQGKYENKRKIEELKEKLVGDDDSRSLDKIDSSVFEDVDNQDELKEICKKSLKNWMLEIDEKKRKKKVYRAYVEVWWKKKPSKLFEGLINAWFSPEQALRIRLQARTKEFKARFGDWERVVKPYNRRTSKQATVKLNKISGERFYVNPDAMNGIILTDTNGHSIFNAMGRTFVLCNVNGNVIPFYQSSRGSSDKIKGNWYPFFGYTGNWLIKGWVNKNGKMSYSSEIDRVTELLNKYFKIPTDFNNNGISESTGIDVKDLGLNMYSVFDRFRKYMQEQNTTDPNALVFFDKDLDELTNANALFVKEITGIKTEGIKQSHESQSFIRPFIAATETSNTSKVVDENGEPLIVYHWSAKRFKEFDIDKIGSTTGDKSGFYFSNNRKITKDYYSLETGNWWDNVKLMLGLTRKYKPTVYNCFLRSFNPYIQDFNGDYDNIWREKIIADAREKGYDAVILKNIKDGPGIVQDVYVVFHPSQINIQHAE